MNQLMDGLQVPPNRSDGQSGFTLIELMIVIALLVILVTIGVPSFQNLVVQNRATAVSNDLLYHLQLARSEALRHSVPVTVCPITSDDPGECAAGTDWKEGWLIFLDENGDGVIDSPSDRILRVEQAPKQITSLVGPLSITFEPAGGASIESFALVVEQEERWVCVELSGRAEVSKAACS